MAWLIQNFIDGYHDLLENRSDPRVKNLFLMSSPLPTIALSLGYAIFVKKIGPKLMENRKPFKLNNILIVYNALQVVFSSFLFYEACICGWLTTYNYRCQPVDFSNNPMALRMVRGCYLYYLSKFTEFFDTFFFVLRKKFDHISTLHVIHHGIMPISVWWGVKFFPGGHSSFFGFLNTFVHIVMYTYYMFAAMGPQYQKYLWWKKYLTLLQIVQFVLVALHSGQLFFIDCDYPKAFVYAITGHAVLFYILFSQFYKKEYVAKRKRMQAMNGKKYTKMAGVCFPKQSALYEDNHNETINNGYTTSEDSNSNLKHRVFVSKNL